MTPSPSRPHHHGPASISTDSQGRLRLHCQCGDDITDAYPGVDLSTIDTFEDGQVTSVGLDKLMDAALAKNFPQP